MQKTIPIDSFELLKALINLTGELEHGELHNYHIGAEKVCDYQHIAREYLTAKGFSDSKIDDFLSGEEQMSDYIERPNVEKKHTGRHFGNSSNIIIHRRGYSSGTNN